MAEWQPIETAPMDTDVILGWWQTWPEKRFCQKMGWAGKSNSYAHQNMGVSDAWLDGEATMWQPAPPPPEEAPCEEYPDNGPTDPFLQAELSRRMHRAEIVRLMGMSPQPVNEADR